MLIAVNTRFLIKDKLEGIGWFTFETMKRLTARHPEHTFLFLFDRPWHKEFIFSENIIPVKVWPPARHPYLWKYWFEHALPKIFKKYKPDLFISTDGFLSLQLTITSILVIHDLAFEHFDDHIPSLVNRYYRKYTPVFAKKADRIITVSEFTRQDIMKQYSIEENKIDVVYNGANENYKPISDTEKKDVKEKFTDGKNYFIYVGSIHPRKNIKNLLLAFDALKKEYPTDNKLVIAGRMAWKTEETKSIFENMSFKHDVLFTGHLQLNELTKIVAAADAMVYPSFFEGFGIPVLEARYCAVPVIASNTSSLPEVAGADALYFNPHHVDEIKDAMKNFLQHKNIITEKFKNTESIKAIFDWDKTVERIEKSISKADSRFLVKEPTTHSI